jgi:hypothetical protein
MHDCPGCGVPLHGYEENCPSCGTRQVVRRQFGSAPVQKAPGVNMMPFIILFVLLLIGGFAAAQMTWIGQVMKGPPPEDPMAKVTYMEARNIIETKLNEGLAAVGATGTFEWKNGEQPGDKNAPNPVSLTVKTKLTDAQQHKAIVEPVKEYMEKANIPTLTMIDEKAHATWTYTMTPAAAPASAEGGEPPPAE